MPEFRDTTMSGPLGTGGSRPAPARRSNQIVETMARDLAATRREAAALRRENERLRARLGIRARGSEAGLRDAVAQLGGERRRAPVAGAELWCSRCGAIVGAPAAAHEHVLVLAACCPHCDGPLVGADTARALAPGLDPSTYLG